jgi:hypothetical protein
MRRYIFMFLFAVSTYCAAQTALSPDVKEFVKVDAPIVALTHVRVLDGTGAAARDDQTIVISGGKIASIGPSASTPAPQGAQVIDSTGRTTIFSIPRAELFITRWNSASRVSILPAA